MSAHNCTIGMQIYLLPFVPTYTDINLSSECERDVFILHSDRARPAVRSIVSHLPGFRTPLTSSRIVSLVFLGRKRWQQIRSLCTKIKGMYIY